MFCIGLSIEKILLLTRFFNEWIHILLMIEHGYPLLTLLFHSFHQLNALLMNHIEFINYENDVFQFKFTLKLGNLDNLITD